MTSYATLDRNVTITDNEYFYIAMEDFFNDLWRVSNRKGLFRVTASC